VATHELKTWPEFFAVMDSGTKTFEYRKNDRGFVVGDVLRLREWKPNTGEYTGRDMHVRVTYVVMLAPGLPEGYCIMQTEKVTCLYPLYR